MMDRDPAHDPQEAAFLRTLRVLCVEDDPCSREGLAVLLRRRVASVVLAADGAEGLAAFQATAPHLVVTDIQMPVMDGLAMAAAIRDLDPRVPIVVTTAFDQADRLLRAIELRIDRYVVKPIQTEQLVSALLDCAHRLMAEEQLRLKGRLEAEAERNRHHAAMHLLFAGIAHDFNNLMQTIFTSIDLVATTARGDGNTRRLLDLATSGSLEMHQLSQRLRILSNSAFAADRVGPVEELLRGAVEEALQGSSCVARYTQAAPPAGIRHHAGNLAMVFQSIAENAREAMPEGGTLEVLVDRLDAGEGEGTRPPDGPFQRFRFRDQGRGIAPEDLPRIFDPYFTTKQRGRQRGMGLGLALCEAVVRTHGGRVSATSVPGSGTTVEVLLPLADGPA